VSGRADIVIAQRDLVEAPSGTFFVKDIYREGFRKEKKVRERDG
jgi:hypothetical protein